MQGDQASMIFTDPPYNVKIKGNVSGLGSSHHREFAMASGEMTEVEFIGFLKTSMELMVANSTKPSVHYLCMDWRHIGEMLSAAALYSELLNVCVWAKDNAGMGSFYRSQHEFIFVFKNGSGSHQNNVQLGKNGRNRSNVWSYPGLNSFARYAEEGNLLDLHPTVKPIRLVADAVLDASVRGDIVLDPFMGSGTTLLAAERTGRRCYGIEIDPLYVDTIIRRWQMHTGGEAVQASSSRTFNSLLGENVYE
jgi:DNA modification methylase